jgi:uncharacterized membrane protein
VGFLFLHDEKLSADDVERKLKKESKATLAPFRAVPVRDVLPCTKSHHHPRRISMSTSTLQGGRSNAVAAELPKNTDVSDHSQQKSCSLPCKNVGRSERIASLVGGAALVLAGRRQGSWPGLLLAATGAGLLYRGATGKCYAYQKLGISTNHSKEQATIPTRQGVKVDKRLLVNRPAAELYRFWRDLSNLPRVFQHLVSVEELSVDRSKWVARGPMKQQLEWEAEILTDRPNEVLAWRSLEGSQVDTAGSVRFEESANGRGTNVVISLKYNPPGGQLTDYLASWFGSDLQSVIDDDLRKFKSRMEAGEVPTTAGQPRGAR